MKDQLSSVVWSVLFASGILGGICFDGYLSSGRFAFSPPKTVVFFVPLFSTALLAILAAKHQGIGRRASALGLAIGTAVFAVRYPTVASSPFTQRWLTEVAGAFWLAVITGAAIAAFVVYTNRNTPKL
jgi:hypothetical protein